LRDELSSAAKNFLSRVASGEFFYTLRNDIVATIVALTENIQEGTFGERGESWFASSALVFFFICKGVMPLGLLIRITGIAFMSMGASFVVSATLTLRESISPFIMPIVRGSAFTSSGPYDLVRHPMYGGVLLFTGGWALASSSLDRAILTFILGVILDKKARMEENILKELFVQYVPYSLKRNKFVPYLF